MSMVLCAYLNYNTNYQCPGKSTEGAIDDRQGCQPLVYHHPQFSSPERATERVTCSVSVDVTSLSPPRGFLFCRIITRGLTPPSVFFRLFETLTSRTTISVESESSVFVCFMNTDCTDSPDFSISKDKPFVLFVKFVVGPIFCFVSETLMDKSVGDKRRLMLIYLSPNCLMQTEVTFIPSV